MQKKAQKDTQKASEKVTFLRLPDGEKMAYKIMGDNVKGTGCVFFSGFLSDMMGRKAQDLTAWSHETGRPFLCFDHLGHGFSTGNFADATVGRMLDDIHALFQHTLTKPQILVGSSMGGWLAYHIARLYPEYVAGLLLLAPAFNFIKIFKKQLPENQQQDLVNKGVCTISLEEGFVTLKRAFFEDNTHDIEDHASIHKIACPVHIVHAMGDEIVPWERSMTFFKCFQAPSAGITLLKGEDHRLSSPSVLRLIRSQLGHLLRESKPEQEAPHDNYDNAKPHPVAS